MRFLLLTFAVSSLVAIGPATANSRSIELAPEIKVGFPFSLVEWNLSYFPYDIENKRFYEPFGYLSTHSSLGVVCSFFSGGSSVWILNDTSWPASRIVGVSLGMTSSDSLYQNFRDKIGLRFVFAQEQSLNDGKLINNMFGIVGKISAFQHFTSDWSVYVKPFSGERFPVFLQVSYGYSFESAPILLKPQNSPENKSD